MAYDATLIKPFTAGAAINPYRLLKGGAADNAAVQAVDGATPLVGCSTMLGADAGERADVYLGGIGEVVLGGPVTRFTPITADLEGKAVAAVDGDFMAGLPLVSGVAGDVVPYLIQSYKI